MADNFGTAAGWIRHPELISIARLNPPTPPVQICGLGIDDMDVMIGGERCGGGGVIDICWSVVVV